MSKKYLGERKPDYSVVTSKHDNELARRENIGASPNYYKYCLNYTISNDLFIGFFESPKNESLLVINHLI